MSAARFSPADGEKLEGLHWEIVSDSKVPSHSLWTHASKLAGRSLVHARTPWGLFMAVGHGMLGWLLVLEMGSLHRDISIGNVLMLDPPVTKPFGLTMEQLVTQLRLQDGGGLAKHVSLLETTIKGLDFPGKCYGSVIDGDMPACLVGGLLHPAQYGGEGTYEFMSWNLVNILWDPQRYLHSPVDDLESFYAAQWAAAFNDGASGKKHDGHGIRQFREKILGDRRSDATLMVLLNQPDVWEEEEYGAFFTNSTTLLRPWFEKLNALITDWKRLVAQAKQLEDTKMKEHLADNFLVDNFLVYGYRGVAEYFELIHEHRVSLEEAVYISVLKR